MTVQSLSAFGAYLYAQYRLDPNLAAFVSAYNTISQQYLNTFNQIGLPIYPNLTGALLDWVGLGVYGYPRPTLPEGIAVTSGPIDADAINAVAIDGGGTVGTANYVLATDDFYVRCLNWHFFKGDGKQFTVPWLKRRVARFLYGPGQNAGYPGVPFAGWGFDVATYLQDVSVVPGATTFITVPRTAPSAALFQLAVRAGILELPFQRNFLVALQ